LVGGQDTVMMQATYPAFMPVVSGGGTNIFVHLSAWTLIAHTTQLVQ
jgi:hypothetical protein